MNPPGLLEVYSLEVCVRAVLLAFEYEDDNPFRWKTMVAITGKVTVQRVS
ncbi:hypothetical protein JK185_12445 [Gluconobacter wancherniae]|nr:hypothetical protein [Gluconobacter wancherniae]MBS1063830.1 hypothetical protein [Gluconobacter wancherniae]